MKKTFYNGMEQLSLRAEAIKLSEMKRVRKPSKRELNAAIGRISDTGIVIGVSREEILECLPESVKTLAELERWEKKVKDIILSISPEEVISPKVCGSHKGFMKAAGIARDCLKKEILGTLATGN